jgi:hypothetical protein
MNSVPLAQSADKQVLFARLGLNENIHRLLLVRDRSHSRTLVAKTAACIAGSPTREGQLESKSAESDRPVEGKPFHPGTVQVGRNLRDGEASRDLDTCQQCPSTY